MHKQGHITTHALPADVARYLTEDETMPVGTLAAYDALGTRPTSVHESEANHCDAILVLGRAIESCLDETTTDSHERSMIR